MKTQANEQDAVLLKDAPQEVLIDFKTRTIAPDERNLILLVLDESIKIGINSEFYYPFNNDLNHQALQRTTYLKKTIEEKKLFFDKLDQRSYTYNRILDTAKLALRQLQDMQRFNYYSAELIVKFIQIEDVFGERRLKSVGVRFIEDQQKIITYRKIKENVRVEVDEEGNEVYLFEGVTGKKLAKQNKINEKEKEIADTLKALDFEDESIDNESEEKADITKLNFE